MMMFNKCKHVWQVTGAIYYPPTGGKFKGRNAGYYMLMMFLGITVISYKCEICGKYDTNQYLGEVQVAGFEWSD
jgi:hypothetical protein